MSQKIVRISSAFALLLGLAGAAPLPSAPSLRQLDAETLRRIEARLGLPLQSVSRAVTSRQPEDVRALLAYARGRGADPLLESRRALLKKRSKARDAGESEAISREIRWIEASAKRMRQTREIGSSEIAVATAIYFQHLSEDQLRGEYASLKARCPMPSGRPCKQEYAKLDRIGMAGAYLRAFAEEKARPEPRAKAMAAFEAKLRAFSGG